jgi:antitoxin component of MazEF toxin-antitoxin module
MGQIEQRTISRVGGSSLMITLPRGWLNYFGLKAGDKVAVITNGELIIRPISKREQESGKAEAEG